MQSDTRNESLNRLLDQGLETARSVEDAFLRAEALNGMAQAIAHAGDVETTDEVVEEALEAARSVEDA